MVFAVTCLSWIPIPYYSWIKPFWGLNNWLLFLKSTLLGVRSGIQKWTPKTSQAGKWTQPTGPTSFLPTLEFQGQIQFKVYGSFQVLLDFAVFAFSVLQA